MIILVSGVSSFALGWAASALISSFKRIVDISS